MPAPRPCLAAPSLTGALFASACALSPAASDAYDAEGVHVRHVRIQVAPSHSTTFESMMAECVRVATAAALPEEHEWLCYFEPPTRYWLLWFSETPSGFAAPAVPDPLVGFVNEIARHDDGSQVPEALATLDYHIEWHALHRQKTAWSTVSSMNSAEFKVAGMMVHTVRPGEEAAFKQALAARTAFLGENGYPFPIEGFVTLAGAPGTALQVAFPTDWSDVRTSFRAFAAGLSESAGEAYSKRSLSLRATTISTEVYDGEVRRELCYAFGK